MRAKLASYKDLDIAHDDLKREHTKLLEKADELERETNNWKEKSKLLNDLEGKLLVFATEYERLIQTLAERNNEIETWRAKYVQLEVSLQKLSEYEKRYSVLKNENAQFKKALEDKSNELDEWISRYGQILNPINEIDDLKKRLDNKNREIRSLEDKILSLKEEHSREMQKMLHKYSEIDSRAKRMIISIDEKTEDGIAYKQKYDA